MGRSVHISTEIPPPLSMLKRLGISKVRQRELAALLEVARVRLAEESGESNASVENAQGQEQGLELVEGLVFGPLAVDNGSMFNQRLAKNDSRTRLRSKFVTKPGKKRKVAAVTP